MRVLLAIAAAVLATSAGAAGEVDAGDTACRWELLLNRPGPELSGIAALGDGNVWAVGSNGPRGAMLHWNGRRWQSVASPVLAYDIDAVSMNDIWAVGSSVPGGPEIRPRAEHWNGRRWRAVSVPGRSGAYLRAVAAISSRDVWAVGAKARGPLVMHWGGAAWKPMAGGPRDGLLHGIDALSPSNIWAVGAQGMTTLGPQSEDSLVERLRGKRWQPLRIPELDWLDDRLLEVSAASSGDVWAVGSIDEPRRAPLVEHWDGQAWTVVSTNGLPKTWTSLSAVVAFGPEDVWTAGSHGIGKDERTLLAHWDGRRWMQVPGPRGALADLAALAPGDIWAAGGRSGEQRSRSLIEHYSCTT